MAPGPLNTQHRQIRGTLPRRRRCRFRSRPPGRNHHTHRSRQAGCRRSRSLLQECLNNRTRRSRQGPLHTPQASSSPTQGAVVADAVAVSSASHGHRTAECVKLVAIAVTVSLQDAVATAHATLVEDVAIAVAVPSDVGNRIRRSRRVRCTRHKRRVHQHTGLRRRRCRRRRRQPRMNRRTHRVRQAGCHRSRNRRRGCRRHRKRRIRLGRCHRGRNLLRDVCATALVDLARSVAHAAGIEFTNARVDVVTDAVAVGVGLWVAALAECVKLVATRTNRRRGCRRHRRRRVRETFVTVTVSFWDVRNRTRIARSVAHATGVEDTDAVDVVADAVAVGVGLAWPTALAECINGAIAIAISDRDAVATADAAFVQDVSVAVAVSFWDVGATALVSHQVRCTPQASSSPTQGSASSQMPSLSASASGVRRTRRVHQAGCHRSRNRRRGCRRHRRRRIRQGRFRRSRSLLWDVRNRIVDLTRSVAATSVEFATHGSTSSQCRRCRRRPRMAHRTRRVRQAGCHRNRNLRQGCRRHRRRRTRRTLPSIAVSF